MQTAYESELNRFTSKNLRSATVSPISPKEKTPLPKAFITREVLFPREEGSFQIPTPSQFAPNHLVFTKIPPLNSRTRFLLIRKLQQLSAVDYESVGDILKQSDPDEVKRAIDQNTFVDVEKLNEETIMKLWEYVLMNKI